MVEGADGSAGDRLIRVNIYVWGRGEKGEEGTPLALQRYARRNIGTKQNVQITPLNILQNQLFLLITPHRAHVHHSLSMKLPQRWHSQPSGWEGFACAAFSRAMRDWMLSFCFFEGGGRRVVEELVEVVVVVVGLGCGRRFEDEEDEEEVEGWY